jgi:uncharacterized glyoxalase superfamily protein PhnB
LQVAKLSRIAPEMPASDLASALEYYEQRMGFRLAMRMTDYAIVERDGVAIHLFEDGARKHSPVGLHIFTEDLDELFEELRESGALITQAIEKKPWSNREFRVKDDFGNETKFTEPV